jgi:hypothetical protein
MSLHDEVTWPTMTHAVELVFKRLSRFQSLKHWLKQHKRFYHSVFTLIICTVGRYSLLLNFNIDKCVCG